MESSIKNIIWPEFKYSSLLHYFTYIHLPSALASVTLTIPKKLVAIHFKLQAFGGGSLIQANSYKSAICYHYSKMQAPDHFSQWYKSTTYFLSVDLTKPRTKTSVKQEIFWDEQHRNMTDSKATKW